METLTQNQAMAITAFAGGAIGSILAISFIFYVLLIIADWKIFTKAGEKGWKSIIPIYNVYLTFKIAGIKSWFWITFCATLVQGIISGIAGPESTVTTITYIISIIIDLVAYILFCGKMSKAFGKGTGFAIGMFFFPNIFTLILGFGSAEYQGIEE